MVDINVTNGAGAHKFRLLYVYIVCKYLFRNEYPLSQFLYYTLYFIIYNITHVGLCFICFHFKS
jgi:hypothetical protein